MKLVRASLFQRLFGKVYHENAVMMLVDSLNNKDNKILSLRSNIETYKRQAVDVDALRTKHAGDIENLRIEHSNFKNKLSAEANTLKKENTDLSKKISDLSKEKHVLIKKHEDTMKALEAEHRAVVNKIKEDHAATLSRMAKDSATAILKADKKATRNQEEVIPEETPVAVPVTESKVGKKSLTCTEVKHILKLAASGIKRKDILLKFGGKLTKDVLGRIIRGETYTDCK